MSNRVMNNLHFSFDKIVLKLLGTLAALLPTKINSEHPEEKQLAEYFLSAQKLRVVLHVECETGAINPTILYLKLRKRLKKGAIDINPKITSINNMENVCWAVSST